MSYDTSIRIPACDHCRESARYVDLGNMTSNVGGMYYKAMPGPYPGGGRYDGVGEPEPDRGGLTGLSGLRCSDATPILRGGIAYMQVNEDEMRALEPANGLGSYSGALRYLCSIADACEQHPTGILAVNW
jgi:hypothetical protein